MCVALNAPYNNINPSTRNRYWIPMKERVTVATTGAITYAHGRVERKTPMREMSRSLTCLKKYVSLIVSTALAPMRLAKRTNAHTSALAEARNAMAPVEIAMIRNPATKNSLSPSHRSAIFPMGRGMMTNGMSMTENISATVLHENPRWLCRYSGV